MSYHTQMEAAKKGIVTGQMRKVAQKENLDEQTILAWSYA